ncbi:MAG: tripartite tricarboxylate transporter substrate binding protein [Acidobacteria bacterium]|nr:tripartite tricarboxylate transporter substrate binding protein [Acidobacteriota bacterium]
MTVFLGGSVSRVAVLVLAALGSACAGSTEPRRVVTLVTHSSPGGGSDVFLREMIPHLTRVMGGTFIVQNIQGGSGAKAMAAVAGARPDGTLVYATTPTFIYTSLLSDPAARYTDLEPLVNLFFDPEVLYTAADSTFATLGDVLDRARTGRGRWGAANPASLERQVMERLKQRAGVAPAITTFEGGGDMLINVLNHTLDMGVGELQEIRAQLDAGRLRLLAIVGDERLPQFPDVATLEEQGIALAVRKFRGLAGPKGLPADVIAAWEAAIPKLLDDPTYRQLYTDNSLQPGFMPHAEYAAFMRAFGAETEAFLKQSGVIQ